MQYFLKHCIFISSIVTSKTSNQNWVNFFSRFEQENKDFVSDLSNKHPELTHSQFRVCIYLRSGYDARSIASELDLSIRSVESHCFRIRKKFDLNHTINLATYLYSIS